MQQEGRPGASPNRWRQALRPVVSGIRSTPRANHSRSPQRHGAPWRCGRDSSPLRPCRCFSRTRRRETHQKPGAENTLLRNTSSRLCSAWLPWQCCELGQDGLLACYTDCLVAQFTAAEIKQRGNAPDVEPRGESRILIHVHFRDCGVALLFAGDLVEHGREHLARSAPVGPKVHQDRPAGLQHFAVEVRFVEFNGRFHVRHSCNEVSRFGSKPDKMCSKLSRQRRPPVMRKVSPVSHAESVDARNTAVGAMSCTWPIRPSGVCDSICFRKSLSCRPAARTPSVSTIPGVMALTRICRGPSSFASVRVIASTAPLVAL